MFPTGDNISSMAFQVSEIGILTLGMMLAILIGGIDLSVNATANLSAILAGMVLARFVPEGQAASTNLLYILLAIGVAFAAGAICGLINGILIAYVEVPAILGHIDNDDDLHRIGIWHHQRKFHKWFSGCSALSRQRQPVGYPDAHDHPDGVRNLSCGLY